MSDIQLPAVVGTSLWLRGGRMVFSQPQHYLLDLIIDGGHAIVKDQNFPTDIFVQRSLIVTNGSWSFPKVRTDSLSVCRSQFNGVCSTTMPSDHYSANKVLQNLGLFIRCMSTEQ